jgi:hypothetical protein
MKRSLAVSIPVGLSLVGCGDPAPRVDPCAPEVYDRVACETAVANRGTYNGGLWIPFVYANAALWYAQRHRQYVASGGRVQAVPGGYYAQSWRSPDQRLTAMRKSPALNGLVLRPPTGSGFRSRAFTYAAPGRSFAPRGGFGATGRTYSRPSSRGGFGG